MAGIIGVDLKDKKFGQWTVIEYAYKDERKIRRWKCICDCGNISYIITQSLTQGKSTKCKRCASNEKIITYKKISYYFFNRIRHKAKERNIEFHISVDDIWNQYLKQDKKCNLSGIEVYFSNTNKNREYGTASVDRIDSNKDYTIDNIQIVHKHINMMKNIYSQEYFIEMCSKVALNNRDNDGLLH